MFREEKGPELKKILLCWKETTEKQPQSVNFIQQEKPRVPTQEEGIQEYNAIVRHSTDDKTSKQGNSRLND